MQQPKQTFKAKGNHAITFMMVPVLAGEAGASLCVSARSAAQLCSTCCDAMDCSHQAPVSMEFSRQESWSGWPPPPPDDLCNPRTEALQERETEIYVDIDI